MDAHKVRGTVERLFTLFQRRIWQIAWDLWEHRNNLLHNEGNRAHRKEVEDLNSAIESEWEKGRDTLPQCYNSLFNTTLQILLDKSQHSKQQWLNSVWTARWHHDGEVDLPQADNTAVITYKRWFKRTSSGNSDSEEEAEPAP